tara:strand:- start:500 stop:688 length:189 start_codon:yes stop_codon:yes gene_type:complete
MKHPLSNSFLQTYIRLPPRHQDHTIESFVLELKRLDPVQDLNEIKITQEAITELKNLKRTAE